MKKYFTFFVLLSFLSANPCFSQNTPFPESGALWKEQHVTLLGVSNVLVAMCGDTTINGREYQKINSYLLDMETDTVLMPFTAPHTFIRSDGPLVFVKYDSEDEQLLYDFSLEAGDSIALDIWSAANIFRVDSVKSEMLGGQLRRVIYFGKKLGIPQEYWIEGIGSNYGLLQRGLYAIDAESSLLCHEFFDYFLNLTDIECFFPDRPLDCDVVNATDHIFAENKSIILYPNPSSHHINIAINNRPAGTSWQLSVYSYLGKKMEMEMVKNGGGFDLDISSFPAGIYFIKIKDAKGRQIGLGKFLKI
ncbi:MAG TPA: T9SS type A sorting domain-containing protein [Bacteroidetes bacterium]|nr:T9SS type A sorting domain-containing protein [Bacteroidota bacterium]